MKYILYIGSLLLFLFIFFSIADKTDPVTKIIILPEKEFVDPGSTIQAKISFEKKRNCIGEIRSYFLDESHNLSIEIAKPISIDLSLDNHIVEKDIKLKIPHFVEGINRIYIVGIYQCELLGSLITKSNSIPIYVKRR